MYVSPYGLPMKTSQGVCPGCGRCQQCGQPTPTKVYPSYPQPYVYPQPWVYPVPGPYWSTIGGTVQVTC